MHKEHTENRKKTLSGGEVDKAEPLKDMAWQPAQRNGQEMSKILENQVPGIGTQNRDAKRTWRWNTGSGQLHQYQPPRSKPTPACSWHVSENYALVHAATLAADSSSTLIGSKFQLDEVISSDLSNKSISSILLGRGSRYAECGERGEMG